MCHHGTGSCQRTSSASSLLTGSGNTCFLLPSLTRPYRSRYQLNAVLNTLFCLFQYICLSCFDLLSLSRDNDKWFSENPFVFGVTKNGSLKRQLGNVKTGLRDKLIDHKYLTVQFITKHSTIMNLVDLDSD